MRVLFVCSGNAHRSPLAEALLKKVRPDLEVDSAGLHVAIPISTEVRNYLAKQNAEEYLKRAPETLAEKNLESYDIIVAMEQRHKDALLVRCPGCEGRIVVWNVEDPYFMAHDDAQRIYRKIEQKAEELAESLQGFPRDFSQQRN